MTLEKLKVLPINKRLKWFKEINIEPFNGENAPDLLLYAKWLSIENISDHHIRKERLRHLGCTENDLKILFSLPYTDISDNTTCDLILRHLSMETLLKINNRIINKIDLDAAYGPPDKENFAPMLFCLQEFCRQLLMAEFKKLELLHRKKIDHIALILQMARVFDAKIKNDLSPCLVTEYHAALAAGLLSDIPSDVTFKHFACNLTNNTEWVEYFFEEYPVMLFTLDTLIGNWLNACLLFFKRFDNDLLLLNKKFQIPMRETLVSVEFYKGDLHQMGQSTSLLTFSNGEKLLYKPHSLEPDCVFQTLASKFQKLGLKKSFRDINMLSQKDYGWQEYIAYQSCKTPLDVKKYFNAQGINLSLFYLLGISDIIGDNILADGSFPCFIDLECLISPQLPIGGKNTHFNSTAGKYLKESVVSSGLIPHWAMGTADDRGINISGLSKQQDQMHANVKVWKKDENGLPVQKIDQIKVKSLDRHLPSIDGIPQMLTDHIPDFIHGFEEGYRFLLNHKTQIEKELGILKNIKVRILIRHTNSYARVLQESRHPEYMKDAAHIDVLFDHYWGAYDSISMPGQLIQSEINQLWNGDIPYFYTHSDSNAIFDGYDNHISDDFFRESGIEGIKRRLERLSPTDMTNQISIIKRSLAIFENYAPDIETVPLFSFSHKRAHHFSEVKKSHLIEKATAIGNQILSNAFQAEDDLAWLDISIGEHGQWEQSVKPPGLYDGTDGIALFFAYLHQHTNDHRFKQVVDQIVAGLLRKLEANRNLPSINTGRISYFTHPVSTLYLLDHLNSLYGPSYESDPDIFYGWIETQLDHDNHFDFFSGSAGAIHFLLNRYEQFQDEKALELAIKCGNHLVGHATKLPTGFAWKGKLFKYLGGFTHGTSAIAWVLFRLAHATGVQKFHHTGEQALFYDRSLYSEKLQGWRDLRSPNLGAAQYWCHGSSGIGLSRLLMANYYEDDVLYKEMDQALQHIMHTGPASSHCICHGLLGNLEIAYALANKLKRPSLQSALLRFLEMTLQAKTEALSWSVGILERNIDLLGMFLGFSGIGYNLLRFADWKRTPSILAGESPFFRRDNNPLH